MTQNSAMIEEISDMLIECPLFNRLESSDISSLARYFNILDIKEGETIFREGDDGTFMCIVHKGDVSIIKANEKGEFVEMATTGAGRAFGEMAVLDGERRSATCMALSDCIFLTISRESMDKLLDEQPRVGTKVLRAIAISLSRRMRWTSGKLVDLSD